MQANARRSELGEVRAAFPEEIDELLAYQARAAERERLAADRERLLLG